MLSVTGHLRASRPSNRRPLRIDDFSRPTAIVIKVLGVSIFLRAAARLFHGALSGDVSAESGALRHLESGEGASMAAIVSPAVGFVSMLGVGMDGGPPDDGVTLPITGPRIRAFDQASEVQISG